jgi:hypothetical protein
MQAILFFLVTLFSSRDFRPVYSGNSPEIVMVPKTATEATYRFSAYFETSPGEGCEGNTVLYFVPYYLRITAGPKTPQGMFGGERREVIIRRDGSTLGAELPASVFRVRAGTRISYHVEYMIGGRCKTRPTYQIFPLLELVGDKRRKQQ